MSSDDLLTAFDAVLDVWGQPVIYTASDLPEPIRMMGVFQKPHEESRPIGDLMVVTGEPALAVRLDAFPEGHPRRNGQFALSKPPHDEPKDWLVSEVRRSGHGAALAILKTVD